MALKLYLLQAVTERECQVTPLPHHLVLDRGEASLDRQSKKQLVGDIFQNGVVFSNYEVRVLHSQKYYVVRVCVQCLASSNPY